MRFRAVFIAFALCASGATAQKEERAELHPGGTVKARYTVDAEGRKDGLGTEFAPDGTVLVRANYKAGLLDGRFESFHPNGKRAILADYRAGKLEGNFLETRADGTRAVAAVYHAGVLGGGYQSWHPDGGRWVVATWRAGKLEGAYEETFAGGGRVWTATWRDGRPDGDAKLTEKGKVRLAQSWKDGRLVALDGVVAHPVPAAELRAKLLGILAAGARVPPSPEDPLARDRAAALARLQAYRCLCGLPWEDLVLDPVMNDHCQAAAQVLAKLGYLTHRPDDPGGLPPGVYAMGRRGAGNSNISSGSSMAESVDGYMDDSDESNIDRVGHRRWCLNPPMRKTGFGAVKSWSAMWSMDRSGSVPKDLATVRYPPAGFIPADLFAPHIAWSVSFLTGPWTARTKPSVSIEPLDARYLPAGAPLPLLRCAIAGGGYGAGRCIVFLPKDLDTTPGRAYLTTVSLDGGATPALRYLVEFAEPLFPSPK